MARRINAFPSRFAFLQTVTLESVRYQLRLVWRERPGAWYMDLTAADGTALATGRRVSPDADPLEGLLIDGGPPGRFVVLGPEPYRVDQLGVDVQILYLSAAEVAEGAALAAVSAGLIVEVA